MHLLAALLEDKEGIVSPVLEKIGIGPQAVLSDIYREIEKDGAVGIIVLPLLACYGAGGGA